jgi:hypothetical protein
VVQAARLDVTTLGHLLLLSMLATMPDAGGAQAAGTAADDQHVDLGDHGNVTGALADRPHRPGDRTGAAAPPRRLRQLFANLSPAAGLRSVGAAPL